MDVSDQNLVSLSEDDLKPNMRVRLKAVSPGSIGTVQERIIIAEPLETGAELQTHTIFAAALLLTRAPCSAIRGQNRWGVILDTGKKYAMKADDLEGVFAPELLPDYMLWGL